MDKNKDFCIFILTHGRPDRQVTHKTLIKGGYEWPLFFVVDNEDKTVGDLKKKFGDQVVMFDKEAEAKLTDSWDNFPERRAVVYARNAVFGIAKGLGYKYFLVLDDDYTGWQYRFDNKQEYSTKKVVSLAKVIYKTLEYYKSINAVSLAFMQGGDIIGGKDCDKVDNIKLFRKCMNTFFCCTDRPFTFMGKINEDVNAYVYWGSRGYLFLSVNNITMSQVKTQSNAGGLTDIYLDVWTYVKSFYSVMYCPSCVKVKVLITKHRRLHHAISWENAVPKILNESLKR